MERDRGAYQGMGFNGKCMGEVTLPPLAEPRSAPEEAPDTPPPAVPEARPVTIYCPTCNIKMTLLPSNKVWCPQCKSLSEVRSGGSAPLIAAVIGVIMLLGFVFFYAQGTFDHLLYSVGLNWETCGLSNGEVLCSDQLVLGADSVTESVKAGLKSRI
jgi:hypothetical protein